MNLHIPTEFNCYIRHIHALLRKLVPLEIVIQQTNRQGALRFYILPDDEIHGTLFDHFHIFIDNIMHHDMNLLRPIRCMRAYRPINALSSG